MTHGWAVLVRVGPAPTGIIERTATGLRFESPCNEPFLKGAVEGQAHTWLILVANIDTTVNLAQAEFMGDRKTMNISVPTSQRSFIQALVDGGRYRHASEVVREGLRLLEEAEHRRLLEKWLYQGLSESEEAMVPRELLERAKAHIQGLIDAGIEDARAGRLVDGPETMRRLREELNSRKPA